MSHQQNTCQQARSYKNEVILLTASRGNAQELVNLVLNLGDWGYNHWVVTTMTDAELCSDILGVFPEAGTRTSWSCLVAFLPTICGRRVSMA